MSLKNIYLIKNKEEENFFFKIINNFYEKSLNKKLYLGLDLEFNTEKKKNMDKTTFKIALMQIFIKLNRKKYYFVIYPPNLDKARFEFLKINIMSNENIIKILHGGESLDIPVLINEFYEGDKKNIMKFFKSLIDTRYLCEYINAKLNEKNLCKINNMLLYFKIISQKRYNKILKNEEKMGHIYDIIIDINNLSPELLRYSVYDIKFLVKIYKKLKKTIIKNNLDYYLLENCIRISFIEKKSASNKLFTTGEKLDILNSYNNYYINTKLFDVFHLKVKIYDVFKQLVEKYFLNKPEYTNLISINYLKTTVLVLMKNIVYSYIYKNYIINKFKHNANIEDWYDELITYLNQNNFISLCNFIISFYNYVKINLKFKNQQ